jgi:putative protease
MKLGVKSLKIEGRLRSETYVRNIVKAYRIVIDADEDSRADAIEEGSLLINEAMGRRTSSGYFNAPRPNDAIVRHQSGNIGSHLGRVESILRIDDRLYAFTTLKKTCQLGERIRLHVERTGERLAFTLAGIKDGKNTIKNASAHKKVSLLLPSTFKHSEHKGTIELYRVDTITPKKNKKTIPLPKLESKKLTKQQNDLARSKIAQLKKEIFAVSSVKKQETTDQLRTRHKTGAKKKIELWLRVDSTELILGKLPFNPDRYVLHINKKMMSHVGQIKNHLGRNMRSAIWALPPVLHDSTIRSVEKQIAILMKTGFRAFQIAHLSQLSLFIGERVHLYGDYTLNLLNSQSINLAAEVDLKGIQFSIETDKSNLQNTLSEQRSHRSTPYTNKTKGQRVQLGLTVYGAPPLFTSRIAAENFSHKRTLVSPKNEQFYVDSLEGYTQTRSKKPFSLLPYKQELQRLGLDYLVVDLSGMKIGKRELADINDRIQNKKKLYKLPTFNYLGTLE